MISITSEVAFITKGDEFLNVEEENVKSVVCIECPASILSSNEDDIMCIELRA